MIKNWSQGSVLPKRSASGLLASVGASSALVLALVGSRSALRIACWALCRTSGLTSSWLIRVSRSTISRSRSSPSAKAALLRTVGSRSSSRARSG